MGQSISVVFCCVVQVLLGCCVLSEGKSSMQILYKFIVTLRYGKGFFARVSHSFATRLYSTEVVADRKPVLRYYRVRLVEFQSGVLLFTHVGQS